MATEISPLIYIHTTLISKPLQPDTLCLTQHWDNIPNIFGVK